MNDRSPDRRACRYSGALIAALFALAALGGCGQKGDLYHPDEARSTITPNATPRILPA